MEQEYTIKPAGTADIPVINKLANLIWPHTYHFLPEGQVEYMLRTLYSAQAMEQQITEQRQQFLLLLNKSTPIGFASYTLGPEPDSAKLNKLYVLPEYQGKGLGRMLLTNVEQRVRKADSNWLFLNVNRQNPAFGFYQSLGFKVAKEEDIPIGPFFMNDYVLVKELGAITPANR